MLIFSYGCQLYGLVAIIKNEITFVEKSQRGGSTMHATLRI